MCKYNEYEENTCHEFYNCCDCGGIDCGCEYCFSCNACDECIEEKK